MSVTDRFLKYVSYDTQSVEDREEVPSTEKQFELARVLRDEMLEMGLKDVFLDEKHCYVYGVIPSNISAEELNKCRMPRGLGLIAHMDTATEASGANVKPRIVKNYDGGDVELSVSQKLSPSVYPSLLSYIGQDLIVTDGTTLLGADDKAGVAEIMALSERLMSEEGRSIKHGRIALCFTPDEEVGHGPSYFDMERMNCDFAYTVDGGRLGELEYENFYAAALDVRVKGVGIHPGSAKSIMKNASRIAEEFDFMLPAELKPEYTDGHDGFFHLENMKGAANEAELRYLIREFDRVKFDWMKRLVICACDYLNAKYGEGVIGFEIRDNYRNMLDKIRPHMHLVETAKEAFKACGVEPIEQPIRGGTDGAELSWRGLPCPNLSTGGENFHSVSEYIPVQSMEKMVDVLTEIARLSFI